MAAKEREKGEEPVRSTPVSNEEKSILKDLDERLEPKTWDPKTWPRP